MRRCLTKRMAKTINSKLAALSSELSMKKYHLTLHGLYRNLEILKEKCPKCGRRRILCVYIEDVYGEDLFESDYYIHICPNPNCDFLIYHIIESTLINPNRRNTCWFCNRKFTYVELRLWEDEFQGGEKK